MKKLLVFIMIAAIVVSFFGCAGTAPQNPSSSAPASVSATASSAAAASTEAAASASASKSASASEAASPDPMVTNTTGKTIKIGVSFDSIVSPFWSGNLEGMKAEAAKHNVELVTVMAGGDAAKQNQQIEQLIAQGVQAIICGPKDSGAIISSVQKCKDAKIPMIMDNRSVSGDVLPDVQVVADNQSMAKNELEAFAQIAKKEGKKYNAILLIGGLSDENAVFRKKGHDEAIKNNTDVYNVVAEVPSDWNLDTALKGLQNALQAHPETDMIITPSDFLFPPIQSSLQQVKKWAKRGEANHVVILSFDGDEVGMQYLKDGYSEMDNAQNAALEGQMCVQWALKLINGGKPEQNIIYDPGQLVTYENFNEMASQVWSYKLLK
jgi:ABC-type sugar transport system substrate-binding protein